MEIEDQIFAIDHAVQKKAGNIMGDLLLLMQSLIVRTGFSLYFEGLSHLLI